MWGIACAGVFVNRRSGCRQGFQGMGCCVADGCWHKGATHVVVASPQSLIQRLAGPWQATDGIEGPIYACIYDATLHTQAVDLRTPVALLLPEKSPPFLGYRRAWSCPQVRSADSCSHQALRMCLAAQLGCPRAATGIRRESPPCCRDPSCYSLCRHPCGWLVHVGTPYLPTTPRARCCRECAGVEQSSSTIGPGGTVCTIKC